MNKAKIAVTYILWGFLLCSIRIMYAETYDTFDESIYRFSHTFAEVAHLVHTKSYVKITPANSSILEDALTRALKGFVSFDIHSKFLDLKEYDELIKNTQGEISGIGVLLGHKAVADETTIILDTVPDSPAEKAGIQAGDKIISIDSKPLKDLSVEQVSAAIKGPINSTVILELSREGITDPIRKSIERKIIKEEYIVTYYFKDYALYYIALSLFTQHSAQELERILTKTIASSSQTPCKGLILDLRNNVGGVLQAAVAIAGLFVPKDSLIVSTKDRDQKVLERFFTQRTPLSFNCSNLVILIDTYTASAAEILAGALKYYADTCTSAFPTTILIGTASFGKGSVQELIALTNDCALKLTTALYYLPDNTSIQGVGIAPDIIIEKKMPPSPTMQWLTKMYGKESNLSNTLKAPLVPSPTSTPSENQTPPAKTSLDYKQKRQQQIASDYQVQTAICALNFLALAPTHFKQRTQAVAYLQKQLICNDTLAIEEITATP